MPGLWRNENGDRTGKFLVQRRDGSVPEWPAFVIGAADPAAPAALRAYANKAERLGFDAEYVTDVLDLALEFERWRAKHWTGDPAAPPHRKDDPAVIARMGQGG